MGPITLNAAKRIGERLREMEAGARAQCAAAGHDPDESIWVGYDLSGNGRSPRWRRYLPGAYPKDTQP